MMTHDALDFAYATLGLPRDASAVAVKKQYRALVKKWHPDQFANSPQNVAEATLMLKAINGAYATVLEHRAPHVVPGAVPASPRVSPPLVVHPDLSDEQRDEIIAAILHSDSLLDVVFHDSVAGWLSRALSLAVAVLYVVGAWPDVADVLLMCVLPLACIWFPDTLGRRGRYSSPSPPLLVWLLGWVILLTPLAALTIWKVR